MSKYFSKTEITKIQQEIFVWYAKNKRDFPWRKTADPYKILVSEVMLQQTQTERVVPKYVAWIKTFPGIEQLAKAEKEDVLRLWNGLGYNRRALNLQTCAKLLFAQKQRKKKKFRASAEIQQKHGRKKYWYWPQAIGELERLPGVGPYTARAVACFAFDRQVAFVDTNIRKVILTLLTKKEGSQTIGVNEASRLSAEKLQEIAQMLLPKGRAYDWNQALMDYSSLYLRKKKIFVKKSAPFKNSNRYFRGKLIRFLLQNGKIDVKELGHALKDSYNSDTENVWLSNLLKRLKADKLIQVRNGEVTL